MLYALIHSKLDTLLVLTTLSITVLHVHVCVPTQDIIICIIPSSRASYCLMTVFALAVMEYAVGVSKFGKNPKTLLVHQY